MITVDDNANIRAEHDRLLAEKPEGVEHDITTCPICADSSKEGEMSDKTYTEDELRAAVEAAMGPLQAEITSFKTSQEAAAIDAKIEEALAPLRTQVETLQASLDVATVRAETAERKHDDLVAFLDAEVSKQAEAAAATARRADRIAAVKEVAEISDALIEKSADRWAAMDEEPFAALLEEFQAIGTPAKKGDDTVDPLLGKTAMQAAREDKTDNMSDMRKLFQLNLTNTDIRTI